MEPMDDCSSSWIVVFPIPQEHPHCTFQLVRLVCHKGCSLPGKHGHIHSLSSSRFASRLLPQVTGQTVCLTCLAIYAEMDLRRVLATSVPDLGSGVKIYASRRAFCDD